KTISEKEHSFEVLHKNKEVILFQDRDILRNVIINLLSNAIKYSPPMSTIHLVTHSNDSQMFIQVKDFGIGIPEQDQKFLLEPFFRANNALNIQGTGLGLNIVKHYLNLMGGELTFTSIENSGSTFTATFPLEKKEE
ncbi:MAG: ATP-binding protein, partial [Rhizobacter sp.]|nr:ATP-binding protein [Bacteriovorax sp.]